MGNSAQVLRPIRIRSKTDAACDALSKLAGQVGPGGRLPTVASLCKSLQISRMTLDRALGRLERQRTIVRKHGQGLFAAQTAARTIGVLFGLDPFRVACSPFYSLLFDAIRSRLAQREYELEVYVDLAYDRSHLKVRRRLKEDIAAGRIQGLLLPVSGREQWDWVSRQGIPFVGGGGVWMKGFRVGYDWQGIVDWMVTQLAERGCRRIGLVSHPLSARVMREHGDTERRYFEAAMNRDGLPVASERVYQISLNDDEFPEPTALSYEEKGFALGHRLAAHPDRLPDGLLIMDDMVARGLLTALSRAGIQAGQDIQVATHVNRGSPALAGYEKDLIHVELDPAMAADAMVDMLEGLMEGESDGQGARTFNDSYSHILKPQFPQGNLS